MDKAPSGAACMHTAALIVQREARTDRRPERVGSKNEKETEVERRRRKILVPMDLKKEILAISSEEGKPSSVAPPL